MVDLQLNYIFLILTATLQVSARRQPTRPAKTLTSYISGTKSQASAALRRCKAQSKSDLSHNSDMRTMLKIKTGLTVPFLLLVATIFTGQIHATGEEDDTKAFKQIRKELVQHHGSEDAGSVTDGSIASATISESITASPVENSQAATKVTSSDQSSPNSTTSRTASASVTGSVPFAFSFASLAEPSTNCTGPGGGCVGFLSSLSSCSDDSCACDLSYPAQVCAQCLASDEAIDSFNSFLKTCEDAGYVAPTSTVLVEVKYCEENKEPAPGSEAYSGLTTDSIPAASKSSMLNSLVALATDSIPELSAPSKVSLVGITSYSAIPHSPTSSSSPSGSAQVSDMRTLTAGASTLSGTIFTEDRVDIGALNSAHEFFNNNILLGCSNDCEKWKRIAQVSAG